MPVMDEFRDEVEKMKHAPFKKRVAYFFDYYTGHVIAVVIALVIVGTFVYEAVTAKDTAFYAVLINAWQPTKVTEEMNEEFINHLATGLDINLEEESIIIDSSTHLDYDNPDANFSSFLQKLVTLVAAQTVDVIVTQEATFERMVESEYFVDLYDYLSEEQIEQYEDQFYYVDRAYYTAREESDLPIEEAYRFPEYDPNMKEGMEDPMAVGVYLDEDSKLLDYYLYAEGGVVAGVVISSTQIERGIEFVELMKE